MIKKKFCIIGKDNDFIDIIKRNLPLFLGYFSNKNKFFKSIGRKKWLGVPNEKNWLRIKKKYNPDVIMVIDEGKIREKLLKTIFKKNCKNYYFKKSYISKTTQLKLLKKRGVVIQDFAKVMSNVKIGDGVKINIGAHIHHDCKIGKYVTIAPKALLLGNVNVGEHAYIGGNATIKQRIKIGKGAVVGAGAVVTKNVKNFDIVAGVPAKSIKK